MIKAIAIDKEPPALKQLEQYCGKVDFVDLQKTFQKTADALAYLAQGEADLLFLDTGRLAGYGPDLLRQLPEDLMIILMSPETPEAPPAVDCRNVVDVLVKPFRFERFAQAITRVSNAYAAAIRQQQQHLFVRADYRLFRLRLEDIVYIEGLDDYLKIHLERSKPIVARMTMKHILEQLPADEFIRVHRSYIVPVRRIQQSDAKTIAINGTRLPIGASYGRTVARRLHGQGALES